MHHTTLESTCDRMCHQTNASFPRNRSMSGRDIIKAFPKFAGSPKLPISSSQAAWTVELRFGKFTKTAVASVPTLATGKPSVISISTILVTNSFRPPTIGTLKCGIQRLAKLFHVTPTRKFPTVLNSTPTKISNICLSPEWLIKRLFV